MQIKPGDKVRFTGQTEMQRRWGSNDDASFLIVGREYVVETVQVHSQHTKLLLKNVQGRFNSVCFELVNS